MLRTNIGFNVGVANGPNGSSWNGRLQMHLAATMKFGFLAVAAMMFFIAPTAIAQDVAEKVVGPKECAECHKDENEIWKATHHYTTFRDLPRNKEARSIAERVGIKRIKSNKLCTSCHFTMQAKDGKSARAVSGISCESCHSHGKDWYKVHSEYSGKKKATETPAEAKARWAAAEKAGMIRPANMYELAKNCYSCHVVPREKLVNVGKHPAGSKFDLVSWSQGEIRHNVWYNNGKQNRPGSTNRLRIMHVVGTAVELETALRSVGEATERKEYAVYMARRAAAARANAAAIAKALGNVPEMAEIAKIGASAGLKLNNRGPLTEAADKIAALTKKLAAKYDGSTFSGVDGLLPAADKYKGKPAR